MSRNERLRDSTVVVSSWSEGSLPYHVTIVDGVPRLETCIRGVWAMHVRSADVVSLLWVHVEQFVKNPRLKAELCAAHEREAKARGHVGDQLRSAEMPRIVEHQIRALPAPWNVEWRERR